MLIILQTRAHILKQNQHPYYDKFDNFEIYKTTMRKMLRVSRLHRMVCERDISQMGIHHSQHHLLVYIAKEGEISSQKEIAERFGVTPAAVARSLKSLEIEGLVERTTFEGDSRFNRIKITDKGKEIIENSYKIFEEIDNNIFEDFTIDEINQFNGFLDRMQLKLIKKNDECCCVRKTDEKQ